MVVFHLNLLTEQGLIADPDGEQFQSMADAKQAAIAALREIAAEHLRCGTWNDVKGVQISTIDGLSLQYVTSEEAVRPLLNP